MTGDLFAHDYLASRQRFREATAALGLSLEAHPIGRAGPDGKPLTIDVAVWRRPGATRALVVSSGLHGVEGFLGAAVQHAWLTLGGLMERLGPAVSLILVHALNPFGYAHQRRWNEDGVDLNRNFLLPGQAYAGAPPLYPRLHGFINPPTPPARHLPLWPDLLRPLLAYGFGALKRTIPFGQYDFPKGLYFGGKAPSATQKILRKCLPRWLQGVRRVTHLDIHTGLGEWASYKLLVEGETAGRIAELRTRYGHQSVEVEGSDDDYFQSRGGLGPWCEALAQAELPGCHYDFMTLEFGSYSSLRIFDALRDENRAHHWAEPGADYRWTKERVLECFAPVSDRWRRSCVDQGVEVCRQACTAMS